MTHRSVTALLRVGTALGFISISVHDANAGAFAVREQSANGQGASFAGVAAGGALSSMFWNPATITQHTGKTMELVLSGIMPHASHNVTTSSLAAFGNAPGDSGLDALVPASYFSWQFNQNIWFGMSVNAPFGLGVRFPQVSAVSSGSGNSAKLSSYNLAPTVAYKFNDMVSVAIGLQAQYMKASYDAFLGTQPRIGVLSGDGWSYGWTAGITVTPLPKTQIGLGYRSAINQKISGRWEVPAAVAPATQPGDVHLTLPLPDTVTLGLRQGIGERFTLLAGVEWANWSRIGTVRVLQSNDAPVTVSGSALQFPFQYRDGWFYSIGGEYAFTPEWTGRAGIAFERTPIYDTVRTARIPDNDRIWYSIGATWKPAVLRGFTFDLGYTFIDVKNASVCMGPAAAGGCPSNPWSSATLGYNGSVSSYVNIIAFAVSYHWDDPAPKRTAVIAK